MLIIIRVFCTFLDYTYAVQEAKDNNKDKLFRVSCFGRIYSLSALDIEREMKKKTPRSEWTFAKAGDSVIPPAGCILLKGLV